MTAGSTIPSRQQLLLGVVPLRGDGTAVLVSQAAPDDVISPPNVGEETFAEVPAVFATPTPTRRPEPRWRRWSRRFGQLLTAAAATLFWMSYAAWLARGIRRTDQHDDLVEEVHGAH